MSIDEDKQITSISEFRDISVQRAPADVLAEAQQAAQALISVVSKKKKPVLFQGEQYLEFEDWLTLARFYSISARVVSTGYVSFDGPVDPDLDRPAGFEAVAEAVHVPTGNIVSRAEAMCMNDEANWRKKPLFQLRSMAQTRACAKALRNCLAWVVVLAGYRPTPAEEMEGVIEHPAPKQQQEGTGQITEAQRKKLYALSKTKSIEPEVMRAMIVQRFGVARSDQLNKQQASELIQDLEKSADVPDQPAPVANAPVQTEAAQVIRIDTRLREEENLPADDDNEADIPRMGIPLEGGQFMKVAVAMGFRNQAQICTGLGVKKLADWQETRELALEKLLEAAHARGELKSYKNWLEITV